MDAFGRARSGQSSIVARVKGGAVFDVTDTVQLIGEYSSWDPQAEISVLAKELGLKNPWDP